jgi:hypothetical protein
MSWMSAAEIAAAKLPCLPQTKQGVIAIALREGWATRRDRRGRPLHRERAGRGGGREWHVGVLPGPAQLELAKRAAAAGRLAGAPVEALLKPAAEATPALAPTRPSEAEEAAWEAFLRLPAKTRGEAQRRLQVLAEVAIFTPTLGRDGAVRHVAATSEPRIAPSTIWTWIERTRGLAAHMRITALADRPKGRPARAPIDARAFDLFKSDWLRTSQPTYQQSFRAVQAVAAKQGWPVPALKTMVRRLHEEVPARTILLARLGPKALAASFPHQTRDRTAFKAMEHVCADGHKWDFWVTHPTTGKPVRPISIVWQDLYSNKILSIRHGVGEGAHLVQLALHDMVRDHGAPDHAWLDNGRGFAAKGITGGASHRHRFKPKADDPEGLLVQLGVEVHWSTVAHGQAKPIERAFGDFARDISRHSAFEGAYTGNRPDRKPEGASPAKAVDWETFERIVAEGVAAHNARAGRRTAVCGGTLSFDAAFEASFATRLAAIPTAAQLRAMLLAAEPVTVRRPDGSVFLAGNRYWAEPLACRMGEKVVLRADPDALWEPVSVHALDGAWICDAECVEATGFADQAAARRHAQAKRALIKATKAHLEATRPHAPSEVAAIVLADPLDLPEPPKPAARRLATGLAAAAPRPAAVAEHDALLDFYAAHTERASRAHLRLVSDLPAGSLPPGDPAAG